MAMGNLATGNGEELFPMPNARCPLTLSEAEGMPHPPTPNP